MSWTEDRVSILKKLWGDGHTAAEIAKQLGGVTRNAVIGKAHRLKLSNRVSPIQKGKKPANKNVERKVVEKARPSVVKKSSSSSSSVSVVRAPASSEKSAVSAPAGDLYNLMDLKPNMCRWPSGDPKEPGFGFCGCKSVPGIPYCAEHAQLAYQAATRNRILSGVSDDSGKDVAADKKKAAS